MIMMKSTMRSWPMMALMILIIRSSTARLRIKRSRAVQMKMMMFLEIKLPLKLPKLRPNHQKIRIQNLKIKGRALSMLICRSFLKLQKDWDLFHRIADGLSVIELKDMESARNTWIKSIARRN